MNVHHKVAWQKLLAINTVLVSSLICGSCSETEGPTNATTAPKPDTTAQRGSIAVVVGSQTVRGAAKTAGDKINDNAHEVGEKIGGAVEQTGTAIQSAAEKTYDAVKSGAQKAG